MTVRRRHVAALLAAGALTVCVAGCASGSSGASASSAAESSAAAGAGGTAKPTGNITVFAAASLKATFTELAERLRGREPGHQDDAELRRVLGPGHPDHRRAPRPTSSPPPTPRTWPSSPTAKLVDGTPGNFATNILEIAVPPANPAASRSFADLAKPGREGGRLRPAGPVRRRHRDDRETTGVTLTPVSEESSVTDVLGKVTSGEADAGLVYVTDVEDRRRRGEGIDFAESAKAVNTYPIATVTARARTRIWPKPSSPRSPAREGQESCATPASAPRNADRHEPTRSGTGYTGIPALDLRHRRRRARCSSCCRWWPWWPGSTGRSSSR